MNLIKIDVEGHEKDVLSGALGVLTNHQPTVIFEFAHPALPASSEVPDLLVAYGYDIFALNYNIKVGPQLVKLATFDVNTLRKFYPSFEPVNLVAVHAEKQSMLEKMNPGLFAY